MNLREEGQRERVGGESFEPSPGTHNYCHAGILPFYQQHKSPLFSTLQVKVEAVDVQGSELRRTRGETNVLPRASREEQKKRRLEDLEENLLRGKRMVLCFYSTRKETKGSTGKI